VRAPGHGTDGTSGSTAVVSVGPHTGTTMLLFTATSEFVDNGKLRGDIGWPS